MSKRVLGGVSYYPDHWPEAEWERDMRLIKKSGLDIIRFGEFSWYWIEPREGEFEFAAYDRFMDLAYALDLSVILCTPTAAPPSWLLHHYPHVRLLDQHGQPHLGGRHMICYNDPTAKQLAERVILKLAERYKDHPALNAWQIDNEPTSGESLSSSNIYDYHPETIKAFQAYLAAQYQDIQKLNAAWLNAFWSRSFNEWEEIDAPRSPGIPGLWLAWMKFRDLNVTRQIRWQLDLLRSVKAGFIVGTNIPEVGTVESCWLGQDYWEQCKGLDYVGIDMYVFQRDPEKEQRALAFSSDLIRSAAEASEAEFWVSEMQAGPHRLPWRMTFVGGLWGTDFLRESTKTFIAHGAERIVYFLWRPLTGGQEFGMNGLVNFDGSPHMLTDALPDIMEEARQENKRLVGKPIAYIHYSRDSLLLASGFDPDPTMDTAFRGWYSLLADCGYQIRFLSDEQLVTKEWIRGDIGVLPYTTVAGPEVIEGLGRAEREGARIIAGFSTGYFDGEGSIVVHNPGEQLWETLGVSFSGFDILPTDKAEWIENHPELILDVLVADLKENEGTEVTLLSSEAKPLIVRNRQMCFVAFDVGTLYEKLPNEKKPSLAEIIRNRLLD
jgi:beta-galactosidase